MDSLPQELVDRISSYLTRDDLKQTLTLNKAYNAAAERLSGAFSRFDFTEDVSQQFVTIYGGSRLCLLRELVFRTELPPILDSTDDTLACRETPEELHEKNVLFSNQVKLLFSALEAVEQRVGTFGPARVKVSVYGPTRQLGRQMLRACLHRKFSSWRVCLLAPESLPELRCVRALEVKQGELTAGHWDDTEVSKLDLRMLLDVAKKLPNLEFVGCQLGRDEVCQKYAERSRFWSHYEHDWAGPRRDTRHQFSEAVEMNPLPLTMRRARLDFLDDFDQQLGRLDQQEDMPDLIGPTKRDPFSSSLCTLSHNLRILELRGIVDSSLFQRHSDDDVPWPNLESLVIMFWPVSPSGAWYFQGPNGEGGETASYTVTQDHYPPLAPDTNDVVHDEYLVDQRRFGDDQVGGSGFRIAPNDAILVPLLTAFANAASRMPKLKDANLWSPLLCYQHDEAPPLDMSQYEHLRDRPLAWGIAYDRPSEMTPRRLTWRVSTWRPDQKLHALFRSIGRAQHGDELDEEWTDEQSGDDLVNRDFFSDYEVAPRP